MIKRIFNLISHPKKEWQSIFQEKDTGFSVFKEYGLRLALIGPFLSFYSLYFEENYSIPHALTYSISTYILDLVSVIIFAFIFSKISEKYFYSINFDTALKFITYVNVPIWLSDIVDIYQPLRILSNLGLIYSFYLLYTGIVYLGKNQSGLDIKRFFIICSGIHLGIYMLNALISEMIAMNPLMKKLIEK